MVKVIVDGSNVARYDGWPSSPWLRAVELVVEKLKSEGEKPVVIFDASVKHDFEGEEREKYRELLSRPEFREALPHTDADQEIIEECLLHPFAKILTNDRFGEYREDFPELNDEGRFIRFRFEDGEVKLGEKREEEKSEPKTLEEKMREAGLS